MLSMSMASCCWRQVMNVKGGLLVLQSALCSFSSDVHFEYLLSCCVSCRRLRDGRSSQPAGWWVASLA